MADRVEELLMKVEESALGCTAPCSRDIVQWIRELRQVLKYPFSMYEGG